MVNFRLLFLLLTVACPFQDTAAGEVSVEIHAEPIKTFYPGDPAQTVFGALEFRGGLILTSPNKSFGGISALRVQRDGSHFIAASDRGSWLAGRIVYENDRPAGIVDATMAPILEAHDTSSSPLDSESIAENGNFLYVGIERTQRILRFNFGEGCFLAKGEEIPVPSEVKDLPYNQSLEAIVFVPKDLPLSGTLIAFSEAGIDASGNLKAFLIGGPNPGNFSVRRTDGFTISDAALLSGSDLLILERKYTLLQGASMRIRRLALDEIKPDAVVDGPVLFEADARYQIDNMEAMSVHRTHSGETILTLMSDDNFSPTQRTLLLQFALKEK